jgi:fibronectin type 3 domain-containing protein
MTGRLLAVLVWAALTFGCGGGTNPGNGGGTAPAAPTALTATSSNQQVSLTWTASSGATSYHVKRAGTSGGPYTQVGVPASSSYSDTGLTNGTKYFYVVSALNASGESANSTEVSCTPVLPVPAVPMGLVAAAGNQQVSLTWTTSSGATSYHVKRATTSGGSYTQVGAPSTATFTNTGLTNGTKYFYVVSAVNTSGESANSTEVSSTPVLPIPPLPTGLLATAGNQQVILTWSASSGAASYHVKRATTTGGPYTQVGAPTTASFTNTGLTNGTKYFYVVSAVNTSGESANSTEVSSTPVLPIPPMPTGLVATAGNQQVILTWSASSGATSYHVKRATTSGGPYSQVSAPTSASYTDPGLTNGTTYYYVVSALNTSGESANSSQVSATPTGAADVTITVDPTKTKPISPWIYGLNFYTGITGAPPHLTLDRAGGNRWTAYNWETNASNAGSDYFYQNDNYLSSSTTPAEAVRSFVAADHGLGIASVMTIQLQGLVSADESGPVSVSNPPDVTRFRQAIAKKSTITPAPFTTTPDSTDAYVYMDEFLWAMDQKLPGIFGANPSLPTFVSLDNEPELWNSTHLEVQGANPVSSDNYIAKTVNLTKALKDQFPNVMIFGPVHYGFLGIYNWQGELSATPHGANWFPDKYLPALKTASDAYGKPLVDVYDFHWYSEATDGTTRVTNLTGSNLTAAQVQAIVQSPRSLWDPTFAENSWIANDVLGEPIRMLPRLQAKIAAEFPGTKIAITEYENGGDNHIAGTIAQADNLGIFGSQGVFAATLWPLGNVPYIYAGFRAYRGFDEATASFGDTSLQATSSKVQNVMVYASSDTTHPGRIVFVAINRFTSPQVTTINGATLSGTASVYQMTASSAHSQNPIHPVLVQQMPVSGSSLTITLPALSVSTIEVK